MSKKNWNNEIGDYKMSAQIADHDGWLICDGRYLDNEDWKTHFKKHKKSILLPFFHIFSKMEICAFLASSEPLLRNDADK